MKYSLGERKKEERKKNTSLGKSKSPKEILNE
jgi:hypothetical protein